MAAYYVKHDGSFFSQRAMFLIAIVLLHIGLIYLFESGLVTRVVKVIDPPIQTEIVQDQKKIEAPPPPPPPKLEQKQIDIPVTDIQINVPAAAETTAIRQVVAGPPAPPAPPPPPRADVRTPVRLDTKRSPATDDYYPPTSRRMGETGTALVNICWGVDGKVTGDPKVAKTSNSPRLDEAAVRWASHARLTPGTLNGKPVEGCSDLPVTFRLTD